MLLGRVAVPAAVALLAFAGCGGGKNAAQSGPPVADPGLVHIHGLGVDPADGALFIATHTGLFRAAEGDDRASRVGRSFQDTMGFTVIGPGRFLGSGHPDAQDDQPPMLGLIRSVDAGMSWHPVSHAGKADFHVLRTAGRSVVGYDSPNNRLLRLTPGRSSTQLRKPRGTLIDLAVNPDDERHYVGATDTGLYESRDAGRRWSRLDPRRTGLLAYLPRGGLTLVRGDGVIEQLAAGRTWKRMGAVDGAPGAVASHGDRLFLAIQDGRVLQSADGGRSWDSRIAPGG